MHIIRLFSAAAFLTWGFVASAQVGVPVTNAGFESDVIASGAFVVLQPAGWQLFDPQGIVDQNADAVGVIRPNIAQTYFPGGAPEGSQAALVFLAGPVNAEVGLQQTLATPLAASTAYTLSVDIGNIASGTSLPGSSDGGGVFYNLDGFPGYRIELLAGGVVLATDSSSAGAIPEGEWRTASFSFVSGLAPAQLGQALGIRLVNLDTPGSLAAPAIEVDFDNVRLTASLVPEPAAAALWALGLAGLAGLGLKQKRGFSPASAAASPAA